jgi:hypothetical protein
MINNEFIKTAAGTNYLNYYGNQMTEPVNIRGIYHSDEDEDLMRTNTSQALSLENQSRKKKKKGGAVGGVTGAVLAGVPTIVAVGNEKGLGAGLAAGGAAGAAGGLLGYFTGKKVSGNKEKEKANNYKQTNTINYVGIVDRNYKKSNQDKNKMPIPRIEGNEKNRNLTKQHHQSAINMAELFGKLDGLRAQYNLQNAPSQI